MEDNPFNQSKDGAPAEEAEVLKEEKVLSTSTVEALTRAEVDIAISTAKRYPRDIAQCIKTCRALALRNPTIAGKCNYAVPRGGKKIIGPSVHFARILAHSWGNLRMGSRVIGCDRDNAHLQGVCHDLETNVAETIEMDWPVQAPHTDTPERWKDQMTLAKRAGAAVAMRNAVFETLPFILFSDIAEEAKQIAIGEGKTFEERRNAAIREFKELGVTQAQIYQLLERGGLESITTDDLIYLHGILTAIQEKTATINEIFGPLSKVPVKPDIPEPATASQPAAQASEPPKKRLHRRTQPAPAAPAMTGVITSGLSPQGRIGPETETKTFTTAPPPPPPAPEPKPVTVYDQVREQLLKGGYTEAEFVKVLGDFDLNRKHARSLDAVDQADLTLVLSDWESVLDQLKARRQDSNELPMG